jgi:hypothetical protein
MTALVSSNRRLPLIANYSLFNDGVPPPLKASNQIGKVIPGKWTRSAGVDGHGDIRVAFRKMRRYVDPKTPVSFDSAVNFELYYGHAILIEDIPLIVAQIPKNWRRDGGNSEFRPSERFTSPRARGGRGLFGPGTRLCRP